MSFCLCCSRTIERCGCRRAENICKRNFGPKLDEPVFRNVRNEVNPLYWFQKIIRCMIMEDFSNSPSHYEDFRRVLMFVDAVCAYPELYCEDTKNAIISLSDYLGWDKSQRKHGISLSILLEDWFFRWGRYSDLHLQCCWFSCDFDTLLKMFLEQ